MQFSGAFLLIDRYVGSCLCFLLSLWHSFLGLFWTPEDKKIKKVLVIELVEMGAAVMAYSSLRYIKDKHGAEIYCLCLRRTREAWLALGIIKPENIYAIDDRSLLSFFFSVIKNIFALSKQNLDMIIDFELFTRVSSVISASIRSKFRAGFYAYTTQGLYRGNFFDVKCNLNQNLHISKNLLALTKSAMTLSRHYYNWNGHISNDEIITPVYQFNAKIKSPLILIAPTVGKMLSMRDYPKDLYIEVIKSLLVEYPKHQIRLIGTESHKPVADYILAGVKSERCVNFCGKTKDLFEFLELLSEAEILISNDSGNPHFAAMVGLKTVALFGPETPFVYGPLGKAVCLYSFFQNSPSITAYNHKHPPSVDTECLRVISPSEIVETVGLVMKGKANFGTINNTTPYLV